MDKVLVYALTENIGGVEEFVLNLSRYNYDHLCEYEYIILGSKTPYQSEMDKLGVKYYFVPEKKNLFKNIKELNRIFRKERQACGTIYFNTSGLYYPIPYILAHKYRYRIVVHSHLSRVFDLRLFIHLINRLWIGKLCSKKLACSTPAAEWMFGKTDLNEVKIVPNAIKLERFRFDPVIRNEIRKKLGIQNYFVIGHVGRLTEVKNQIFLLKLIAEAKNKGYNYKLLLVGNGEDEQKLKYKAEEFNVKDNVIFYGKTNKPEELMNCMDCFVMPSLVEGFPITLIEAQANGLPCLISDTITKEVNISGHVTFLSLKEPIFIWLNSIKKIGERYECIEKLHISGYDISSCERNVRSYFLSD